MALAAGGGLFARHSPARSRLASLAREAAGDHQNCAVKFSLAERPILLEEHVTADDVHLRPQRPVAENPARGRSGASVWRRGFAAMDFKVDSQAGCYQHEPHAAAP